MHEGSPLKVSGVIQRLWLPEAGGWAQKTNRGTQGDMGEASAVAPKASILEQSEEE